MHFLLWQQVNFTSHLKAAGYSELSINFVKAYLISNNNNNNDCGSASLTEESELHWESEATTLHQPPLTKNTQITLHNTEFGSAS